MPEFSMNQTVGYAQPAGSGVSTQKKYCIVDASENLSKQIQEAHSLMERLESRLSPLLPFKDTENNSKPVPSNQLSSAIGSQLEQHAIGVNALHDRIHRILNQIEV